MRISDWSSDVCSSDLLGDAARRLQSGRRAIEDRMTLLASRRTFGIETTLTGNSELALMRAAGEAGYQVNLVYVGVRDVRHSIGRVRERVSRGGHDVPIARSEEHTSELQSLMRISSAVFCLKKKKQQN